SKSKPKQEPPESSDATKKEQRPAEPRVSRDQVEAALRKVRERQQEKRERDRVLKARVSGGVPVEKDWGCHPLAEAMPGSAWQAWRSWPSRRRGRRRRSPPRNRSSRSRRVPTRSSSGRASTTRWRSAT